MDMSCRWGALLITLWIHVGCVRGTRTVSHLSREDVLLVKDTQDPKCFTRSAEDLTCFFESTDNRTYDLIYKIDSPVPKEERCVMTVQRTEEETFLHICSFPEDDVLLFMLIPLEVVEHNTNITLHNRTICVEDHFLLNPPFDVSLHQIDQAGQLRVSWHIKRVVFCPILMHRIRYSYKGLEGTTKTEGYIIDSLVPGEEVQVQVSVKCKLSGYWSTWSHPVQHMVPQGADDVALICYTPDLQNITCQWNETKYDEEKGYTLFYKTRPSHTSSWTEWTECLANGSVAGERRFVGDVSREMMVKLSGHPAPLSRTFYTQMFTFNNSIKTPPPRHLTGTLKNNKLCLQWEAPLQSSLAQLQYEVSYHTKSDEAWMAISLEGPAYGTCIDVGAGSQYSVKVRAKPKVSVYSGYWSDWSQALTFDIPTDIVMLLTRCSPFLVVASVVICTLFSVSHRKIKRYFWPPVPNLDKVLQGFLTEINRQKWDLSVVAKQSDEETTSSVVEIMSEDNVSTPESTQLLSAEGILSGKEKVDWSPGTETFPDYVTLNKDSTIVCPEGNNYVYERVGEKGESVVEDVLLQTCHCSCTEVTPCSCTEYLNHSYLPLNKLADGSTCKFAAGRGPGNLYVPCS